MARPEISLAVGDINGDYALDIVVVNQDGQGAVYLNDGKVNFVAAYKFDPDAKLSHADNRFEGSVVVGDLNGDAALDFVVGFWGGQNIVYLNDGSGNFSADRPFGVGSRNTVAMALGDLDGDGSLDLAVAIERGQSVIYLNNGSGNFTSARPLGKGVASTTAIAAGDLNDDGHLDLVTGRGGDQNVVYLNDGLGNFTSARPFGPASDLAVNVILGDVNGDSHLDIGLGGSGQSAVYLNDGTGNFTVVRPFGADYTGLLFDYWVHTRLTLGDMDGNGKLDLIAVLDLVDPNEVTDVNPLAHLQAQKKLDQPPQNSLYLNHGPAQRIRLQQPGHTAVANFYATTEILAERVIPISYTLTSADSAPIGRLVAFYSLNGGEQWQPAIAATGTLTTNLATSPTGVEHRFAWDTYASGFFGQSDTVVLRFVAYLQTRQPPSPGVYRYVNAQPGPYQYAAVSTVTFPFRARGMQIRVVNAEAAPVAGALVYRLPPEQFTGASPIADSTGQPFRTSPSGYLQGRGELQLGDLQRDVPAGYEQTLALYYLPKGEESWQRLPTFQFVENLVAATLQPAPGIYAVMATVALPALKPGPNLFTYPLLDSRPITTALASLHGRYTDLYEVDPDGRRLSVPTMLLFGHVYNLNLKGDQPLTLYLAPPRRSPDGGVTDSQ